MSCYLTSLDALWFVAFRWIGTILDPAYGRLVNGLTTSVSLLFQPSTPYFRSLPSPLSIIFPQSPSQSHSLSKRPSSFTKYPTGRPDVVQSLYEMYTFSQFSHFVSCLFWLIISIFFGFCVRCEMEKVVYMHQAGIDACCLVR